MTEFARNGTVSTSRSRGAITGFALMLLGAWGAIIPFVGPYFDFAYTPDSTWTWTAGRFVLEVLPGAMTFVGGLVLLGTARRSIAMMVAWLVVLAGIWFIVGPLLTPIWDTSWLGTPVGDRTRVSLEQIGFFYGLGAAIVLCASFALGRFSIVAARDVRSGRRDPVASDPAVTADGYATTEPYRADDPPRVQ